MNDTRQPDAVSSELLWMKTYHEETCERYERHINGVYRERNQLVALVMRMCEELGLPYGLKRDANPPEDGWDYIAFFELPSGQCSFHIPNDELSLFFQDMPTYERAWDGHTTQEKYERIASSGIGYTTNTMHPWGIISPTTVKCDSATRDTASPFATQPLSIEYREEGQHS